jgi:hypothetical protein
MKQTAGVNARCFELVCAKATGPTRDDASEKGRQLGS